MSEHVPTPWAGFGYQPVRGLIERRIARYLRTQRKNMERFFRERGFFKYAQQLEELQRNSTLTYTQKAAVFKRILDDYADGVRQKNNEADGTPVPVPETAPATDSGVPVGVSGTNEAGSSDSPT